MAPKDLSEMTEYEAFEHLERVAVKLIRGITLTESEREWIGLGILAVCRGESLNEAFVVKKKKVPNSSLHAARYALVERLREEGWTREAAIDKVATQMNKSPESIDESWDIQNKIQKKFREKLSKKNK